MIAHEDRKPVLIPGMCDEGPPSYRTGETPKENQLTLGEVRERVEDTETLHCVHHNTRREILSGKEVLHKATLFTEKPDEQTHLEYIHQVGAETIQNNQDLWDRRVDPETGRILVEECEEESVWGIGSFLLPRENGTVEPMTPEEISGIAGEMLAERSRERDFSNGEALAAATELVRAVIVINHFQILEESWIEDTEDPEWEASYTVRARAMETLDIAYNYNRIIMAGINLEQHPEYHSYQPFYDMGWKPPSHQEMADHIIRKLAEK